MSDSEPDPPKRQRLMADENKAIVCKTFHYLNKELQFMRDNNHDSCDLSPLSNINQRVCDAIGISKSTLSRILEEEREGTSTSDKKVMVTQQIKRLKPPFLEITSRVANAIRSTMHGIIQDSIQRDKENKIPTWEELKNIFQNAIAFEGSETTLRAILVSMGYRWLLGNDDKKTVIEKHDIQIRRYRFLKDIIGYREKEMTIVYTGARLVHIYRSYREKKSETGFTVFCAGTQNSCLPKTVWIYSAPATIDLEYNIDSKTYNLWLTDYLLPNLPQNSVVVVSEANFNNKQCIIPTEKEHLKGWLRKHTIPFDEDLHKMELLDIVVKNKDKFATYQTDELISQQGHIVLRLPPKHPELNAVELALERIKSDIKPTVAVFKHNSNCDMINSVIEMIKPDAWKEFCEIVQRVELEYLTYYDSDTEVIIKIHDEYDDKSDCSDE